MKSTEIGLEVRPHDLRVGNESFSFLNLVQKKSGLCNKGTLKGCEKCFSASKSGMQILKSALCEQSYPQPACGCVDAFYLFGLRAEATAGLWTGNLSARSGKAAQKPGNRADGPSQN